MKNMFCFLFLFIIGSSVAISQDTKNSKKITGRKFYPEIKMPMVDTSLNKVSTGQLTILNLGPVEIPNAVDIVQLYSNNVMPIKRLSGDNLAPMPGTEKLNADNLRDSISVPLVKRNK